MRRRTRALLVALLVPIVPLASPAPALADKPFLHENFRDRLTLPNDEEGPLVCEARSHPASRSRTARCRASTPTT